MSTILELVPSLSHYMSAQDKPPSQSAVVPNPKIEANVGVLASGLNEDTSEGEYPEGGLCAWATVLGACVGEELSILSI